MLVEKLLQLLIDIVDADLFKPVVVEDLKSGDVEDPDVGDLLHGGVAQGLVALVHHDPEGALVDGAGDAGHRVGGGRAGGALVHPLSSDLVMMMMMMLVMMIVMMMMMVVMTMMMMMMMVVQLEPLFIHSVPTFSLGLQK